MNVVDVWTAGNKETSMSTSVETVDGPQPSEEVIAQTVTVDAAPGAPVDVPPPEVPDPPSKEELALQMRTKFAANREAREAREGAVTDTIRGLKTVATPPDAEFNPFEAPPVDAAIPQPSPEMLGKMTPVPIPVPEPRIPKGAAHSAVPNPKEPPGSPSAKRLGEIGKKLPGSEHIKVRRRDARSGQMQHIGDYSLRDIPQSMDFESFLSAYVRPTHGGGDYYLSGVDARGREMDAGIIRLADAQQSEEPQGGGMMDIMKMMMQREQDANQRMMAMMQNPQRGTDPITQMHQVMGLKKELEADVPSADGPMSAMVQAMNAQAQQSMQMFMAMQQQQQQQQQQMMVMMSAGRNETDPMLAMLMAKAEESNKPSNAPLPPPLPAPPLGGIDLNTLLPTLLTSLPAIVEMLRREDPSVSLLKEMVVSKQGDGLSTRDMVELLTSKTGTDDFKAAAENMGMMLNIQGMMQDRMGGSGGGFFDSIGSALGSLFSNGNFAGSLAENIQASAEQKRKGPGAPSDEVRQVMAARKQLQAEQQALVRDRALFAEERKRLEAPAKAPEVVEEAEAPQGVDQSGEHAIPVEQGEAAERVKARTGGALPEFPPELPDMLNSWLEGIEVTVGEDGEMGIGEVNDAKLAEGVVNTFVFLFQVPTWQPLVGRLFQEVQQANREESLAMIGAFVEAFQSIGALDPKVGAEAMRVMDEHFDAVVATLRGFFGEAEKQSAAAKTLDELTELPEDLTDVSELYEGLEDEDEDDEDEDEDDGGGRAA
jgi:hypothetical protein